MQILHLKFFWLKKIGGKEGVSRDWDVFLYIEMRELVFFWKTVNSRYLKFEVHPKLIIFQNNFSGPR